MSETARTVTYWPQATQSDWALAAILVGNVVSDGSANHVSPTRLDELTISEPSEHGGHVARSVENP